MSDDVLARLETGAGVFDEALLARLDAVPTEQLAERLAGHGGHAAGDAAYVLARRDDARGVAALARAATVLATAHRALSYLAILDMDDMVRPEDRTPERRALADAVDLLGGPPAWIELIFHGDLPWQRGPREAWLFAFGLDGAPESLALVGPGRVRVDGGVGGLDLDDRLAMVCGCAAETGLRPVAPDDVPAHALRAFLGRRAYLWLTQPRLECAWELERDLLLVVAAQRRGHRGFLVGGAAGHVPLHWIESDGPAAERLDARRAGWVWLGRMARAGA